VILPAQALHQHRRRCLPAVSHDFARLGANFARIGADFARVYPRPRYKKALAAPLPSTESAVMALKHRITTVTLSQTKKPAPQEGGIGADFASRLPYKDTKYIDEIAGFIELKDLHDHVKVLGHIDYGDLL